MATLKEQIRWLKYVTHRILYINKDSRGRKVFNRAVAELKAQRIGKNWYRV